MRIATADVNRMPQSEAAGSGRLPRPRLRWIVLAALTLTAATFGGLTGYFVRLDMPDLTGLEDYAPPEMSRLLARDGSETASFAAEKRILLDYDEIPESFLQALIASEDSRFHGHAGIDPIGALRASWVAVRQRRVTQGFSTITMQLAGNLFLDRSQRTLRRKLQEVFLAFEIERRFSKQEIIRTYSNQVHFGHGLYGLEAAARFYFDKSARLLTTGESAMLVGLLPRPASYSPYRNIERATERRGLVLRRMVAEGYLTAEQAQEVAARAISVAPQDGGDSEHAAYFNEHVRRWLQETYGTTDLYRGGIVVETTLDPGLQRIAGRSVDSGLRRLDKRIGWRADAVRRVPDGADLSEWSSPAWSPTPVVGSVTDGVVLQVNGQSAEVRVGDRTGSLASADIRWTGRQRPDALLAAGDVIRVRLQSANPEGRLKLALEQEPLAEAALVALDPSTGQVLALVGGFDFSRSQYDRATQARRQTGSLFKTFAYAAALELGHTLSDSLLDEPTVFLDRRRPVPYQPENFSRRYYGPITLRTALEKSANIATVKLLERTGYDAVIDTARNLGIKSRLRPYPSLVLGAFELTLLEVTSAYGAFANQGLLIEPHTIRSVTDRHGREMHHANPRVSQAVTPQVAYLMNRVLSGVMQRGTGRTAGSVLDRTLAGKTGTTDDYTDAWFVGYSPSLVVGVWVGFDEPESLGASETGSRAALPIWTEFMQQAIAGSPDESFPVPSAISTVAIDPETGMRHNPGAGCGTRVIEVFVAGTEPTERCTQSEHRQREFPYSFQRYDLDLDGALRIPRNELMQLLETEPAIHFKRRRKLLELEDGERHVRLPVILLPETEALARPTIDESLDNVSWRGTDGKPARIVWLDNGPAPR